MNDGTQSLSGLPTFGPREILADGTVLPILECLALREKWGNGTFATHHMINLLVATSFGDSDELTQEQYALVTRNPHNFLDWLYEHRGATCVHERRVVISVQYSDDHVTGQSFAVISSQLLSIWLSVPYR